MRILFLLIGLFTITSFAFSQEEARLAIAIINAGEQQDVDLSAIEQMYRAQDYNAAIKAIERVEKQFPNNEEVLLKKGQILMDMKRYKPAMKEFDKVLILNVENSTAYYYRGLVKDLSNDPLAAIAEFSQAIAVDPDFSLPYEARATTKSRLKDLNGAIQDYTKALALNDKLMLAYEGRGFAYYQAGQYDNAIKDITKVLKSNGRNGLAIFYFGMSKLKKGDQKGCSDLRRAMAMGINQAGVEISKNCQ